MLKVELQICRMNTKKRKLYFQNSVFKDQIDLFNQIKQYKTKILFS